MGDRQSVALVCDECGARNYKTTKPKRPVQPGEEGQTQRLAFKKFCRTCNRHTVHRESR